MAKAEDLSVERSYFLIVYIGISFLELGVFILLQNLICTQSVNIKRKKSPLRECMKHETPIFTLMLKSFKLIYLFQYNYFHLYIIQHFLFTFSLLQQVTLFLSNLHCLHY